MVFVHLYNDNSGSPRVLKTVIGSLGGRDGSSVLFIGSSGDGLLTSLDIPIKRYFYRRFQNKILVLLAYLVSQVTLFFNLVLSKRARQDEIIYINTVLPFGAAIFGRLFRKKVFYHIHEVSLSPPMLFKVLIWIADKLATHQIYVSEYQKTCIGSAHPSRHVVHNCVSDEMMRASRASRCDTDSRFTILMAASLRSYKGVEVFVNLAKSFSQNNIDWVLLANEEDHAVDQFRLTHARVGNLRVLNRVSDPSSIYSRASLVLNLSLVDRWVETFGLTLVEAFSFGLPVIAPPIGGPAEIVEHGKNGFLIDSYDFEELRKAVYRLYSDQSLYFSMSRSALEASKNFTPGVFTEKFSLLIERLT